jgi:hypothetical protein
VPDKKKALRDSHIVVKVKTESSSRPSPPIRRSSRLQSFKDTITTMPSFMSSRSLSFPPWVDDVEYESSTERDTLPDIDENPFAHFLTPVVEEDDPYDGLSLSAGIIVPDDVGPRTSKTLKFKSNVADKWARYVKYNHVQLHQHYHEHDEEEEEESFVTLDDDRLLDTPYMMSQLSQPPRITLTEPTRGRAQELVPSRKARGRRRYSRTLSGHRHSWREPSPDLFTVEESEEDDSNTLMLKRTRTKNTTKDGGERRRSKLDIVEKSKL